MFFHEHALYSGQEVVDGREQDAYNGNVKNEHVAFIIIGQSSAGKSTIANPISQQYSARIYDSDVVKTMIDEFDGGYGAGRVHKESKSIMEGEFHKAIEQGTNIVLPIVGGDVQDVRTPVSDLRVGGYNVYLVLNELDSEKASKRAATRFFTTGRFVDPKMVLEQGSKPVDTYKIIKQEGLCDGYQWFNNDVAYGEQPKLIDEAFSEAVPGRGYSGNAADHGTPDSGTPRLPPEYDSIHGSGGIRAAGRASILQTMERGTSRAERGSGAPAEQRGAVTRNKDAAAEDIRYSLGTSWDALVQKYGAHAQGMDPRERDVSVPVSTDGENRNSLFLRSVMESQHIPASLISDIERRNVDDGFGAYVPQTNARLREIAADRIAREGGVSAAQSSFIRAVESGKVNDETNAVGLQLLAEAAARGDGASVTELISDLCLVAKESGRAVQAFAMLRRLGGVGSAYYMQKVVNSFNEKYKKQIDAGKAQQITIPPDLIENLAKAKTAFDVEDAESAVSKHIGEQLPLTFGETVRNWRYFAMLANPTTHFRNIAGNAMMAGVRTVKDAVATGIERVAVKDASQRTHNGAVHTSYDRG